LNLFVQVELLTTRILEDNRLLKFYKTHLHPRRKHLSPIKKLVIRNP